MADSLLAIVEGPRLRAEIPETTVPDFIRGRARLRPDAVAIVEADTERRCTYGTLDRLIGRFAAGLTAHGFKAGDTLLLFAPNSIEWPIVALGTMAAGGVVSGANPSYTAAELAHQMREANARFAFTIPAMLATVREAAAGSACGTIVLLGEEEGTLRYAALVACDDPEPAPEIDSGTIAALPFSSGTTGVAKGVLLTHRNVIANLCQYEEAYPAVAGDAALAVLPMYHIFGFTVVTLFRLATGGMLVTLPRFEPEPYLQAIEKYRVSDLGLVPPLMQFLAIHPLVEKYDLSSVKYIGCGAAPLGPSLEKKVADRLKCDVAQGFGMTESSGVVAITYRDRARSGSSGQLFPGTQGRIVDPVSGADVPRGTSGELWFRGPQAFIGYKNRPEATADTITADGWVRTGDIGHFDTDGFLFITDRLKELIKVNAFQVAPAELEALLLVHPAIADVAVIGRPDHRAGEVPVAYVVGRGAVDGDEIKLWVAERVAEYKRLADVVTIAAIPKTPSGKILRRVLRTLDAERTHGAP